MNQWLVMLEELEATDQKWKWHWKYSARNVWQVFELNSFNILPQKDMSSSSKLSLCWLSFPFNKLWRKEQTPGEATPEPHSFYGYFLISKWLVTISCLHTRHIHKDVEKWPKSKMIRVMSTKGQPSKSLRVSAFDPNELPETVHEKCSHLFLEPRVAWRYKHEGSAQEERSPKRSSCRQ